MTVEEAAPRTAATPTADGPLAPTLESVGPRRAAARAFWAMCQRDAWVTVRRDPASFLAQALLQPLFFLLIFGRVLPEIGAAQGGYGAQLLPGVVAFTVLLISLQNVALPLVIDFSFTKEIEDRLLAPLPAWLLGVQKIFIAAVRGLVAALMVLPFAAVILPGGLDLSHASVLGLLVVFPVGALVGAAVGMVLGTAVQPHRINVAFAVVLTPLMFTGAIFYPWQSLHALRWFQVITLFNPLTYVSEGMRGALAGQSHLASGWLALGLTVSLVGFALVGLIAFVRRAVD
jgi:ABC-2 type transport system permease protein